MSQGWICLHRRLLEWEWYSDVNATRLFLHCLLKANHKDKKWQGKTIPRGSFVTGRSVLADETGLTQQQIRTALNKLKSTNEITIKATNKNSLVTVVNYGVYQDKGELSTNKTTNKAPNGQPTDNQQITTTNNDNNDNNVNNIKITSPKATKCPHKDIVDLYHDLLPSLPRVKEWTTKRQGYLKTVWSNNEARQSMDYWTRFFNYVSQSDFLMGRAGDFKADLEWLVKPANFIKIIEKKYENRN